MPPSDTCSVKEIDTGSKPVCNQGCKKAVREMSNHSLLLSYIHMSLLLLLQPKTKYCMGYIDCPLLLLYCHTTT